jgi:intermediate cleaving peptidase 55
MNKLRVKKSESEIANMRIAGQASGRAFTTAMRQSFTKEKDLGAMLDYHFKLNGCDGPAYVPVIAGGEVGAFSPHLIHRTNESRML